jgi:hypothetical protein
MTPIKPQDRTQKVILPDSIRVHMHDGVIIHHSFLLHLVCSLEKVYSLYWKKFGLFTGYDCSKPVRY